MCFSATASFAAGGLLLPAGGFCVWSALRKRPAYLALAVMPLAFGVQQCAEGVVWLALEDGDAIRTRTASLVFLFFATAFWPAWVPLQATVAEPPTWRRWALAALTAANCAWFWVLYFPLVAGPESLLHVRVAHHSIDYSFPDLAVNDVVSRPVLRLLYLGSVGTPLLLSTQGLGRLSGLGLGVSAVVSALLFDHAFVSVWCFFAAVLSAYLCCVFYALPAPAAAVDPA